MPIIFSVVTVLVTCSRAAERGRLRADEHGEDQVVTEAAWDEQGCQISTPILDALLPHTSWGYRDYPVGGVQGGQGTSFWKY